MLTAFLSTASFASRKVRRALIRSLGWKRATRPAITRAIWAMEKSALRGQQPVAARMHPFALVVELADDARPHVGSPVVELLLELVLDHLALLLDHQDLFQTARELAHAVGLQRPGHRHLEQADADLACIALVDAQLFERLEHVHVGLAGGDDAQPRVGRIDA